MIPFAGPALMPGGTEEAYKHIEDIVRKVAAQVDDGPCVTYVGNGGAGNFVKMVHNGIEYGDMQLISEAYDILKTVGGFTNEELGQAFDEWNQVCTYTRPTAVSVIFTPCQPQCGHNKLVS